MKDVHGEYIKIAETVNYHATLLNEPAEVLLALSLNADESGHEVVYTDQKLSPLLSR